MARQTKVDFSCFFSDGTGIHRHSASPLLVLPELSNHLLATEQCLFRSQGTPSHRKWDMLQTLLHPCLSSLKRIKDPEGKWYTGFIVQFRMCLLRTVMLGASLGGCCLGPWLSVEGQSLPVPGEGLQEIMLGRSMDRVVE